MYDVQKTMIIRWDIAKYQANILIQLQKYGSHKTIPM